MTDFSGILGDLYGDEPDKKEETPAAPPAAAPPPSPPPAAPEWASEAKLDEAFSDWQPGPAAGAPAAEHEAAGARSLDDDLAAALSAALADATAGEATAPPPPPAPAAYQAPAAQYVAPAAAPPAHDPFDLAAAPAPAYAEPAYAEPGYAEPAAAPPVSAAPAEWVSVTPETSFLPESAPHVGGWHRSSDDILPSNAGGKAKGTTRTATIRAPKQKKAGKSAPAEQAPAGDAAFVPAAAPIEQPSGVTTEAKPKSTKRSFGVRKR